MKTKKEIEDKLEAVSNLREPPEGIDAPTALIHRAVMEAATGALKWILEE
jgi:hypothetical protein